MSFFKRILKPADEPRPVVQPERPGGQRLFHWVVPNLVPAVPDDVREFLRRYAD